MTALQQETKIISQGTHKAQVLVITTHPDGRKTSETKHYRIERGQLTDAAKVEGGRGNQKENGKPKPPRRRR